MLVFAAMAVMAVSQPVLDLNDSPRAASPLVSQALYGSSVTVLERKDRWARVRTPDDYTGWASLSGLDEKPYAAAGRAAMVASLFANVYAEPDVTRRRPVLTLPFEARLEVAAEPKDNPRWVEVRLVGGGAAWVQRGDLAFDSLPLDVPALIAFSKRFLGLPYLWGGTSTFGYDCSGFAQMLCRRRGVTLPRDSAPQAAWSGAEAVDRAKLEPGDLVYFGPSPRKVTHTGMYLGGGEFISATTHGTPVVRIDRLDDPHWAAIFVAARRLK
jgi:cell wall-associated NlpC family hydrolase